MKNKIVGEKLKLKRIIWLLVKQKELYVIN